MKAPVLLTRDRFREAVFARDRHRCVHCGATGVPLDAHHLIERRLWPDGGYYLDNGATLCDPTCHRLAESTELSCEALRAACGITREVLPPHLYPGTPYTKWGDEILPGGMRLRGELFHDASVQAVLAPVLHLYTRFVRPARTWHLPFSPGATSDDRVLDDCEAFAQEDEVVVTLKYDGQHTVLYGPDGYVHARSVERLGPDVSNDQMKALAAELGAMIDEGYRIAGELLMAMHSIHYTNLPAHRRWFFALFNVWRPDNSCLPWDEVAEWAEMLEVPLVPVLYRGPWDEKRVRALVKPTYDGDEMEGLVVRPARGFAFREYPRVVGKYVRPNHQAGAAHGWRHQRRVFNRPRASTP